MAKVVKVEGDEDVVDVMVRGYRVAFVVPADTLSLAVRVYEPGSAATEHEVGLPEGQGRRLYEILRDRYEEA